MKHHTNLQLVVPALLAGFVAFGMSVSQAAVPALINYQAHVTDANGDPIGPVTPVNRQVVFQFWNHASNSADANRLYAESQLVTINGGDFSVLIGQGTPTGENTLHNNLADVFASPNVFLGITVDDGDDNLSNDSEILPRQQIVTTAFAFRSTVAESVDNLAITTNSLAAGAVKTDQLGPDAVTTVKLVNSAVTGAKIAPGTIGATNLADNAVTTNKIIDDAVTSAKIAQDTITAGDLAPNSVGSSELAANSVFTGQIADGNVTSADIQNGGVTSTDLGTGTVTTGETLRIVRGELNAAGGIIAGSGFTATRTSAGKYTVTFSTKFSSRATVTANVVTTVAFEDVLAVSPSSDGRSCSFTNHDFDNGHLNRGFTFIAIGPR